jgi:hypothetical protein
MITPAYSPTATERVLPRLALDFTTGVLDSRVTVTRLLNTATRINASGFIETVNANLPRFDYNPVTLAPRGLLIEEQRINLLLRSAEFENAAWTKGNASITANAEISPDGTVNADKLVEDTANSTHRVFNNASVTITAGAVISYSIFAKAAERTSVRITDNDLAGATFNLSNGTITATDGGITSTITAFPNGWYRCTITGVTSSANGRLVVNIVSGGSTTYTGDGTSGIYIYGAQLEAGAFATSYIPTTTTSLTRNADGASMTGTNFSSWYNSTQGSFGVLLQQRASTRLVDTYPLRAAGGTQPIVSGYTDIPPNIRPITGNTNGGVVSSIAGTVTRYKSVNRYNFTAGTKRGAVNGILDNTETALGAQTVDNTSMFVGSFGGGTPGNVNGWVELIQYWPYALTDAQMQAFSKL